MAFIAHTIGKKVLVEEIGQVYKKGSLEVDLSPSLKSKMVRVEVIPRKQKVKAELGEVYLVTRHCGVSVKENRESKRYLIIDDIDLQCRVEDMQLSKA